MPTEITFDPALTSITLPDGPDGGTDLTPLIVELQNTTAALTAVLEQLTQVVGAIQGLPDTLTAMQTTVDAIEVTVSPMAQDVSALVEALNQITGRA